MRYKGAGAELDEWLPANALQVRPPPTVPALTEMRVWLTRLTTRSACVLRLRAPPACSACVLCLRTAQPKHVDTFERKLAERRSAE